MNEGPNSPEPEVIYPAEEPYFAFSATLRIHGEIGDLEEISRTLGVAPTHTHRGGELALPKRSATWKDDAWHFRAPLDESRPLEEHITALWSQLRPHMAYLKSLKNRLKVDVFCGYRSNSPTAGFQVGHECLGLFMELGVPFGVSVILA